jgi:hypothetical protein
MWITLWGSRGKPGDIVWTTRGNRDSVHRDPPSVHKSLTARVHKKWAANWENNAFPRIHSPYDYDFLITG